MVYIEINSLRRIKIYGPFDVVGCTADYSEFEFA